MITEIEIIRKDQLKETNWSGGVTTELAIYPKEALYSERNFKWRLSRAKVELEESTFTSLPNYKRILMVIEGNFHIKHEGHHECTLTSFEQDRFLGNWVTKSFGKVTDFNLMMTKECEGELKDIHLKGGQEEIIHLDVNHNTTQNCFALYCVNGTVLINEVSDNKITLSSGDLLLIQYNNTITRHLHIKNEIDTVVDIISVKIDY